MQFDQSLLVTGVKLLQKLDLNKNTAISPLSVSLALGMVYTGTKGKTKKEIKKVFNFEDSGSTGKEAKNLLQQLSKETTLKVANGVFGRIGREYNPQFIENLQANFQAKIENVDFSNTDTVGNINQWVASKTEGKINNLLRALEGDINLLLISAVHLKAAWDKPFSPGRTEPRSFFLENGTEEQVSTMHAMTNFGYKEEGGFKIVQLGLNNFYLNIYLPVTAEAELSEDVIAGSLQLPSTLLDLYLPKFRIETPALTLSGILKELGVKAAFNEPAGAADFTGIDASEYTYISDIGHKALVAIDEDGVEAAAATAVVMHQYTSFRPNDPIKVKIDKPFFFSLGHYQTNTTLFIGKVLNPNII